MIFSFFFFVGKTRSPATLQQLCMLEIGTNLDLYYGDVPLLPVSFLVLCVAQVL
jgi:hypothetical protein